MRSVLDQPCRMSDTILSNAAASAARTRCIVYLVAGFIIGLLAVTKTSSGPPLDKAVRSGLAATTGRFSLPVDTTHSAPDHGIYLEIQASENCLISW